MRPLEQLCPEANYSGVLYIYKQTYQNLVSSFNACIVYQTPSLGGRWLLRPSYCYNLKNLFHILQLKRKINYKIIFCGIKYTFTY